MSRDDREQDLSERLIQVAERFDELLFESAESPLLSAVKTAIDSYDRDCNAIMANQQTYDADERRLILESEYRDIQTSPGSDFAWASVFFASNRVGGWIPIEFVRKGRPSNFELLERPVETLPDDLKLVLLAALHDGLVIRRKRLIRSQPEQSADLLQRLKTETPFDHLKDNLCGIDHKGKRTQTQWLCDREFVVPLVNAIENLAPGKFRRPAEDASSPKARDAILPDRVFRISWHEFVCDGRMGDLLRIYMERKDRYFTDKKVGEFLDPEAPLLNSSVRALRANLVEFLREHIEPRPQRNTEETTDKTGFFLTRIADRQRTYRLRLGQLDPRKPVREGD